MDMSDDMRRRLAEQLMMSPGLADPGMALDYTGPQHSAVDKDFFANRAKPFGNVMAPVGGIIGGLPGAIIGGVTPYMIGTAADLVTPDDAKRRAQEWWGDLKATSQMYGNDKYRPMRLK